MIRFHGDTEARVRNQSLLNSSSEARRPMYPVLFRIGSFEITSFGVLVAIGALVGIWVFQRELARRRCPRPVSTRRSPACWAACSARSCCGRSSTLGDEPLAGLLFSRGGMSWFGGLLGGVAAGIWMLRRRGIPVMAGAGGGVTGSGAWPRHRPHRLLSRRRRLRPPDRFAVGRRVSEGTAADRHSGPSDPAVRAGVAAAGRVAAHPLAPERCRRTAWCSGATCARRVYPVRDRVHPRERTRCGPVHAGASDFGAESRSPASSCCHEEEIGIASRSSKRR